MKITKQLLARKKLETAKLFTAEFITSRNPIFSL